MLNNRTSLLMKGILMKTNDKDLGAQGGKNDSQVGHPSLGQGGGGQSQPSDVGSDLGGAGRDATVGRTAGDSKANSGGQEQRRG